MERITDYNNPTSITTAMLDVKIPDIDGFTICQKIREKYFFPVIMLTAKREDMDIIMGPTIGYLDHDILKSLTQYDFFQFIDYNNSLVL